MKSTVILKELFRINDNNVIYKDNKDIRFRYFNSDYNYFFCNAGKALNI